MLYVSELACNLFSVRAAPTKGTHVKFGQSHCWIEDANGKLCGMGSIIDKLYRLNCELATRQHNNKDHAVVTSEGTDMDLWHQRLGLLCEQQLKYMVNKELVTGLNLSKATKLSFCEGCVKGKMC